eukprot:26587_5
MCVSDIRLAFANAQAVCRDNSPPTMMARDQLKLLQDDFEKELFAGKMDVVAYGHRLNLTGLWTRQDLPLSNPTFLEVTKLV